MSKADYSGVSIHQMLRANAVRPVAVASLAALLVAGICFYSAPSFAQASPLSSSGPVVQQGAAAAVPSDLPQLKPAASAGKDDPLAWDSAPAPAPTAVPAHVAPPAPEVPVMPAAKPVAVEKLDVLNKPSAEHVADKTGGGLEKRVAALEAAVAALKSSAATKDDLEALQISVGALQQKVADGKTTDTPAASAAGEEKPKKVRAARTHKVNKQHSAAQAAPWILKAAKPGTAWVSQKGSSGLRTVVVGDTLPGIGKIRSISKDSAGHWTVSGTKGRISQ